MQCVPGRTQEKLTVMLGVQRLNFGWVVYFWVLLVIYKKPNILF